MLIRLVFSKEGIDVVLSTDDTLMEQYDTRERLTDLERLGAIRP